MDRIDAMTVFIATLDEGSLAGAARALKRSPAAVSRAIAFLETHVGVELLHRTTRSLRLSEAGERYAAACRRILTELEEADVLAVGEKSAPRGPISPFPATSSSAFPGKAMKISPTRYPSSMPCVTLRHIRSNIAPGRALRRR